MGDCDFALAVATLPFFLSLHCNVVLSRMTEFTRLHSRLSAGFVWACQLGIQIDGLHDQIGFTLHEQMGAWNEVGFAIPCCLLNYGERSCFPLLVLLMIGEWSGKLFGGCR